jgi:antitoxin MazE
MPEDDPVILRIVKWRSDLALLLPAKWVHNMSLREGDRMEANLTVDGGLCVRKNQWDRRAFARELDELREAMPMTAPVTNELRRSARTSEDPEGECGRR